MQTSREHPCVLLGSVRRWQLTVDSWQLTCWLGCHIFYFVDCRLHYSSAECRLHSVHCSSADCTGYLNLQHGNNVKNMTEKRRKEGKGWRTSSCLGLWLKFLENKREFTTLASYCNEMLTTLIFIAFNLLVGIYSPIMVVVYGSSLW